MRFVRILFDVAITFKWTGYITMYWIIYRAFYIFLKNEFDINAVRFNFQFRDEVEKEDSSFNLPYKMSKGKIFEGEKTQYSIK